MVGKSGWFLEMESMLVCVWLIWFCRCAYERVWLCRCGSVLEYIRESIIWSTYQRVWLCRCGVYAGVRESGVLYIRESMVVQVRCGVYGESMVVSIYSELTKLLLS